jgi:hypothetical protein
MLVVVLMPFGQRAYKQTEDAENVQASAVGNDRLLVHRRLFLVKGFRMTISTEIRP